MKSVRVLVFCLSATVLSGCAVQFVRDAAEAERSDASGTVITGRVSYVVDGQPMAPYRQPGWAVPRFMALSLTSGDPHAFGETRASDGAFRVRVEPGAYVISRFGILGTESEIGWPRLVICVPRAPGAVVHVGHMQLSGQRYAEDVTLSTGTRYTSRGVRYRATVLDETPPGASRSLVRHVPDMPIGGQLQARWRADAAGLERELCGAVLR